MTGYGPRTFTRELLQRHRVLGGFALICLAGAAMTLVLQLLDDRMIGDVSVWLKPTKFLLSIGVFAGTAAWFFGYIRPERRNSALMILTVGVLLVTALFELVWITWQGAHGLKSHFNFDSEFYGGMYALMGVAATLLVGTTLPMAWEIGRRPVAGLNKAYQLAVILGLVLTFFLGGFLGGYISMSGGSPVGEYASHIPLFKWNNLGGDLRIAHFLGLHAEQFLPLLAWLFLKRRLWVILAAIAYAAITLTLWSTARAGVPLFS